MTAAGAVHTATLHGLPARDAVRRVGQLGQLARVDRFVSDDGPGRGARVLRFVTGGGLELEIHPDRALDLGALTAFGTSVTWTSPNGITAPGLYEAAGDGWGRTFGGGLMTTCGLDHVGAPVVDDGRHFPQHGRFHAIPATLDRAGVVGDQLVVEGTVRQATLHQEDLVLRRRISARLGSNRVEVRDVVTNEGWRPEPHLVLYHCNLGWPLVSEGSVVEVSDSVVHAVSTETEPSSWREVLAPAADNPERVYRHAVGASGAGPEGFARVVNRDLGLAVTIRFDTSTLPELFQWSMFRPVQNVLALEPANAPFMGGRVAARQLRGLPVLEPGQSVSYRLAFEVERVGTA